MPQRIVSGEDVARFVSDRLSFALCPPYSAVGLERDGEIVAGVIVNNYEGADCAVTVAGSGWTRGFFRAVGAYIYDQLGCERMTVTTASETVAGYAQRFGGQVEGRLRSHFGPGIDGIIVGILRNEWRY